MYGFGGLGEVKVEIWSDVTIAGRTDKRTNKKERWTAEMSKMPLVSIISFQALMQDFSHTSSI